MSIEAPWLLLMFQLPGRNTAARVRVWRHLQRIGALPLKNSGYVLPRSEATREDMEWVRTEILAAGGDAMVVAASPLGPDDESDVRSAFVHARTADFAAVIAAAKRLGRVSRKSAGGTRPPRDVRALTDQLRHLESIDYFNAPNRGTARAAVEALLQPVQEASVKVQGGTKLRAADFRKVVWLTRPRPGIDRCASAWLIRRFIDPAATFAFADSPDALAAQRRRVVPFDMYGAEFGHHGNACTFETLLSRFEITDPAAIWLGRIVHAIDLKTDATAVPEAATVGPLIEGLRLVHRSDTVLLNRGAEVIEALYQSHIAPSGAAVRRPARGRRR